MTTKQQREALDYFTTHADDWRSKADGLGCGKVNVIEQRNEYVVQVANQHPGLGRFLDVGCGTGELVCQVAGLGADAVGVDYAPAMIDLASKKAAVAEIARANFTCASIFDFRVQPESYDLIAANGFIEYLSQPQLIDFFDLVADALAPGGSLVVGSRNRLFNLVSMNDFTLQELEAEHVDPLLREALMWTKAEVDPGSWTVS